MDFTTEEYRCLEKKFREKVRKDNKANCPHAHYLPNLVPKDKVDFVRVAMEPALGKACTQESKECWTGRGCSNNFVNSIDDFILHFCVRRYLCEGSDEKTYHITDMAKTQLPPGCAKEGRFSRWKRWYCLLRDELKLVRKDNAPLIAIGRDVERFLKQKGEDSHYILHYSRRVLEKHVAREAKRCPSEYEKFKENVVANCLKETVRQVLKDVRSDSCIDKILEQLQLDRNFCERRKKLAFTYKMSFKRLLKEIGQ